MNPISNETCLKKNWQSVLAKQHSFESEENVFCTEDNLEQSLEILSEEFESLAIAPVIVQNKLRTLESLRKLSVKVINSAWNLIHKHKSLMQLHNQLIDSNHRTVNDNVNLKNHVKRLKEDIQKQEHALCKAQERERRLKVQYENVSRDLKHEKKEVWKLKKQTQSKDVQHEHEVRRILQSGDKLQEQLRKNIGTFVPKDKVFQKLQADHEKETTLYKQTICRLEENNRQMLQEIADLKETLLCLHMKTSGIWTDTNT